MGQDRKEVVGHFRPVPGLPFEPLLGSAPNRLRFGLEPVRLDPETDD